ncbi:MAG TPA: hypothetical protein VK338_04475 [Candidatus Nitrosocosmicus sp.]|nr:hypothetical protein [Candidatus Nitrosocosmicus sp.]
MIPRNIPLSAQERVLEAIQSPIEEVSLEAKRTTVYMSLHTIFAALQPYLGKDPDENEELFHDAVVASLLVTKNEEDNGSFKQKVHEATQRAAQRYIAAREDVISWVNPVNAKIFAELGNYLYEQNRYVTETEIDQIAYGIYQQTGIDDVEQLRKYIKKRNQFTMNKDENADVIIDEEEMFKTVYARAAQEDIIKVNSLNEQETSVVSLRLSRYTFTDIAEMAGVNIGRTKFINRQAYSKIRRVKSLREYIIYADPYLSDF